MATHALYGHLLQKMEGDSSVIIRYARAGKLNLLRKGVTSRDTFWDWLLFDGVRKDAGLVRLRALVIEGATEQSRLDVFRLALGCSAVSTLAHATLLAPLTTGMFFDYQRLPPPFVEAHELTGRELSHVGAPTAGVELKVMGEEEDIVAGHRRGDVRLALSLSLSLCARLTKRPL